jgi:hypothetical protein
MLISRAEAISQRRRLQNGLPPRALKNKARDQTIKAKLDPIAGQSIQCGRHRKIAILFLRQAFGMGAQSGALNAGWHSPSSSPRMP